MSKKKKTIGELLEGALVPEEEQPYAIPENWVWVKLGSIIELAYGKSLPNTKRSGEGFPVFGSNGIVGYHGDYLIEGPVIVVGRKGSHGEVNWYEQSGWPIDTTYYVKVNKIFSYTFIYYLLLTVNLKGLNRSTAIPGLNREDAYDQNIAIPPLNEQKRIAEKVERLLSKIEEAKQLIEEAKGTFELRRAAIIKNILKEEFLDDKLPTGWRKIQLKDLFNIFGGGTPSKSKEEYWNGRIPWISAKDMKTTFISKTMDYITEEGLNNSSAKLAKRGSVAMVVRSGILQRTLPVAFLLSECTVNQDLKVFDSGDELINKYFLWYVKGNERSLLHNYSKSGTTVNSIEFEKFKSHGILLPPMDVLKQKIDKIENVIEKEKSANVMLNLANSIDELKSSILSKAFRGELGTNDPSEENAIELLKKVLQEQVK